MTLTRLAAASLRSRRFTSLLTLATIALGVMLLLGVERLRHEARDSFTRTLSGTDLVVGARAGSIQLLLYTVFHVGNPTSNLTMDSIRTIESMRGVDWVVPVSLGDSHRGYRVVGTSNAYFERYRYGNDRALAFSGGGPPADLYHAVVGAEVARTLDYAPGSALVIAHGTGKAAILDHADKPFRVSGVLAATGTPVDRSVIVSLEAIEAIHVGWDRGVPIPGRHIDAESVREAELAPREVTAALVGLTSRAHTFKVQRAINDYPGEALSAILPGAALAELWRVTAVVEKTLLAISVLVVAVGVCGMAGMLLAGLEGRRREIAILRAVGARPRHVMGLLLAESAVLTVAGMLVAVVALQLLLTVLAPVIVARSGIHLAAGAPGVGELGMLAGVLVLSLLAALIPAWRAYRYSLLDGLSVQ